MNMYPPAPWRGRGGEKELGEMGPIWVIQTAHPPYCIRTHLGAGAAGLLRCPFMAV